jgi:hypothetical protein
VLRCVDVVDTCVYSLFDDGYNLCLTIVTIVVDVVLLI